MTTQRSPIYLLGRAVADNLRYWASGRWRRLQHEPTTSCGVPRDFFGICVASAPDAAGDDYVIARLKELGLRSVRLDFTYESRNAYGERFLRRLLDDAFRVGLHLVPPPAEVKALADPEAQERWQTFVAETLEAHGSRLEFVEIGSTCNRRRWSGATPATFLMSWQIACEEARQRGITLAGPNVTDFEPLYNVALLSEMKRNGTLPALHTDNLFVERATEPEAFDPRILGRRLAGTLRFNLVRKARFLQDIGLWGGVPETLCSHVAWSLRRIARVLDFIEEKQADYVTRYGCLAAASGALRRVYWGPLIGQREGLIDDGTAMYPDIPHVTFYGHVHGHLADYRLRPAFAAFRTVNRFLNGATFQRKIPTGPGLEILEFMIGKTALTRHSRDQLSSPLAGEDQGEGGKIDGWSTPSPLPAELRTALQAGHPSPLPPPERFAQAGVKGEGEDDPHAAFSSDRIFHAVWTTNGNAAETSACYAPELLKAAEAYSRDGEKLDAPPVLFTESPVYLFFTREPFPPKADPSMADAASSEQPATNHPDGSPLTAHRSHDLPGLIPNVRFASRPGTRYAPFHHGDWTGFCLTHEAGLPFDSAPVLTLMSDLCEANSLRKTTLSHSAVILRDGRNRVWSLPSPGEKLRRLVIKEFKPCGFWRTLMQRHKPDRAQRSWNGAQELLRRGIPTPQPIAFIHHKRLPAAHSCIHICRAFENGWSAREAFTAFCHGTAQFQGKSAMELFGAIARFLRTLHDRGVFFRDLSAGNLLFRCEAGAEIEFALIDTTRARFYATSVGLRQRLGDLIRLCHPLPWDRRNALVSLYMQFLGRRFRLWMKIPFAYYDAKHRIKKALKKLKPAG